MASGKDYTYLFKSDEDADDAQKITRSRTVRSTISTRVIRSESPEISRSSGLGSRQVLGSSTHQSRSRYPRAVERQQKGNKSSGYRGATVPPYQSDDLPNNENQAPDQTVTALKRAQSEGDLLNGELTAKKLKKVKSLPSLERRVRVSSTEDISSHAQSRQQRNYEEEIFSNSDEGKKRSRSHDGLSWKKPHIDVRRKVELLSQKEPAQRSRSADYHRPRKGILKTKRVTQTNTIRITGSAPAEHEIQQDAASEEQTRLSTSIPSTTSGTQAEPMDYLTYTASSSMTSAEPFHLDSQEKHFQLPKRYRVHQDVELDKPTRPKSMIFSRRWKSEPSLTLEKKQRRSRSMDRLSSEKETKLSNVKIDLIRPIDLKPLKPAYSIGDLPFETAIRNEVKFQLKPQRWKSNPELVSREKQEEIQHRKPGKEFETKIVRALPVHLQPLHQPAPPKETQVKSTEVKDASMQFTSVHDTRSEGTQVFFEPTPIKVSSEPVFKGTQTVDIPEKVTVPAPVVVELEKAEMKKETSDVSWKKGQSKKQVSERLVVEYVPESEKPTQEERVWPTTETCKEHSTEVTMKKVDESKKTRRDIRIGRIDDIDMEVAPAEENYSETRKVKKLKTIHIEHEPTSETSVRYVAERPRRDDMTLGRIESTRKFVSKATKESPGSFERLTVEEITFPRQKSIDTTTVQVQPQQGLKRKKETTIKYEEAPQTVVTTKVGRFVTDGTAMTQKRAKQEQSVGRIEDLHVEETARYNGKYPRTPEIGSFVFKGMPEEQETHKIRKERKTKKKRTDHAHVRTSGSDKVRQEKMKVQRNDTMSPRTHRTTEKVTVSRRDMTSAERTEKVKLLKEQNIGRIVIEEIQEEKPAQKSIRSKEVVRPRTTGETVGRHDLREVPQIHVKEEVIKVQRSDIAPVEPQRNERIVTTYAEKEPSTRKPREQEKLQDHVIEPRYIEDVRYTTEKRDETRSRVDETRNSRREVSTEKVIVTRADGAGPGKIEQRIYPEQPCVGRIVIDETSERREEKPRQVYRKKDAAKPRSTEVTVSRRDVTDAGKPYDKEEVKKVEKLDVHELDKAQIESTRIQERAATYRQRVENSRKWVKKEDHINVGKLDVSELEKTSQESGETQERMATFKDNRDAMWKEKREDAKEHCEEKTTQKEERKEAVAPSGVHLVEAKEFVKSKYRKEEEIGLIVMDEIPAEKDDASGTVCTKDVVKRTSEKRDVRSSHNHHMKNVMKIGKLDVHGVEEAEKQGKSSEVEDISQAKMRKDDTPAKRTNWLDEECDKAYEKITKSQAIDTEFCHTQVTSEKVMVNRQSTVPREDTNNPKYPRKDLDIGRLVIEEISAEEMTLRKDVSKKKARSSKVGKLDLTELEENSTASEKIKDVVLKARKDKQEKRRMKPRPTTPVRGITEDAGGFTKPQKTQDVLKTGRLGLQVKEQFFTPIERVEGSKKEEKVKIAHEHLLEYLDVNEVEHDAVRQDDYLLQREDIKISRKLIPRAEVRVSGRKVEGRKVTEKRKHPKEVNVGRIVVEEISEEDEIPTAQISRKPALTQKATEVTVTSRGVQELSSTQRKEEIKMGKLDVTNLEQVPEEYKKGKERVSAFTNKVDNIHKVREDVPSTRTDDGREKQIDTPKNLQEVSRIVLMETPEGEYGNLKQVRKWEDQQRTERVHVEDKEFTNVRQEATRLMRDKVDTPRSQVTAEVTVKRRELPHMEGTEKLCKYPKQADIGRIVIEEIPEKERETPRREFLKDVKQKKDERTVTHIEARQIPNEYPKDEVKVGKLDVTGFDKIPEKPKPMDEKVTTKVDGLREPRRDKKSEAPMTEPGYIKDVSLGEKRYETVTRLDETNVSRRAVSREKVSVTKVDGVRRDEPGQPGYPREHEVGRIVIEEMPAEKEERRRVYQKHAERSRTTTATVSKEDVTDVARPYQKTKEIKVRRFEIDELLKEPTECTGKPEILRSKADEMVYPQKLKRKVDRLNVQDVTWEQTSQEEIKPRVHKTRQQVSAETIIVGKQDKVSMEDTKKPKHPKEQDIGRIVIEEFPPKSEEILKRESMRKAVRPKLTEVTATKHEVQEAPSTYVAEDVIKVGKLDVTHLEKRTVETKRVIEKSATYRDSVDGVDKVKKAGWPKEQKLYHLRVDDADFDKDRKEETKPRKDIITRDPITTDRVTVRSDDIGRKEETEKPRHPKELDIGRIVIQEIPKPLEEVRQHEVMRRKAGRPRSTEITVRQQEMQSVSEQQTNDVVKVGRLNVTEFEKATAESRQVSERSAADTERTNVQSKTEKTDSETREQRVDLIDVEDTEYDQEHYKLYKPLKDHVNDQRKQATSETIAVSKRDIPQSQDTDRPRYPKEQDIGRIVIEELPEEKQQIPQREVTSKAARPKSTEVTYRRHGVKEIPSVYVTEDIIKVGKLDIPYLKKAPVDSRKEEKRVTTYSKTLDGVQKPRKEENLKREKIESSFVDDVRFYQQKHEETETREDETRHSRRELTTEKIMVTRADVTRPEEPEHLKQPGEIKVGRIVIEEMPEEKYEAPKAYEKYQDKPKTTDVTLSREHVTDMSRTFQKKDMMKVGRLDIQELETRPVESRNVKEWPKIQTARKDQPEKKRKTKELTGKTIDSPDVKDLKYEKVRELKPRKDDTVAPEQVTTEKVTMSRRDIAHTDDTEKPRYPKELNVGRIVIQELPEEKDEIPTRESKDKAVRPKSAEVTVTRHEVEELPRAYTAEDVIKVGKLDVTDLEKRTVESRRPERKVTAYTERMHDIRKPKKEGKTQGKQVERHYIEDQLYPKERRHKTRACLDETMGSRREVSTKKVTVATADGTRTEEIEQSQYPKEQEVGRIIIEEEPEEKQEPLVYKKYPEKPNTTQVSVTGDYVTDVSRPNEKDVLRVGRLGVHQLDTPDESTKVEEGRRTRPETLERLQRLKKLGEKRIDWLHVRDVEIPTDGETKSSKEATVSRKQITGQKVTVNRREIARTEDTENARHPKEPDISRIVIEERPEEKEEVPIAEFEGNEVRPKSTEVAVTRQEIKEVPSTYVSEDAIKVGKLDVTDLEKRTVESRQVERRVNTYKEKLDRPQKLKVKEKPKERRTEPSYIQDTNYLKTREGSKSRVDDTRISRREISSEKVIVTRADGARTEETDLLKYPRERDIGQIVIEEIPEERDDMPDIYRKHPEKPRTTEVTVKTEDVEDVSRPHEKEDVIRVGQLDVHGEERTPVESKRVEERSLVRREMVEQPRKARKEDRWRERIDRVHVQDFDFDEVHKTKPRTDDTEISRQHVTTEKITVNRRDISRKEETEKAKYPRDLDIGRIIIDEIPEEKVETSKREVLRDRARPAMTTELTVKQHELEEAPKTRVSEEVIKVGKFDLTDPEKMAVEFRRPEKRVSTYKERVEDSRKQRKEIQPEGEAMGQRYIEGLFYRKEKSDETEPSVHETSVSRREAPTEKTTVRRADGTRREEIERSRYPKEQDVGRIIIEEVPEEKEPHVYRKYSKIPKTTQVSDTRDVTDISGPYEKRDVVRVGRLDVDELDKTPDESSKVEERWVTQTEKLGRSQKVKIAERPIGQRIDRLDLEDVKFENVRESKPRIRKDDWISPEPLTSETVTVGERDIIAKTEHTEKPRYPKELDVGRIVIEELPEEIDEIPKREFKGKALRPKSTEVGITRHEVQETPSTYVSEDVVKIGKLDVSRVDKAPVESKKAEKKVTTYTERLDGAKKVKRKEKPEERRIDQLDVEDIEFRKVRESTSSKDDTVSREHVTTERFTMTRRDVAREDDTEKSRYPKELDIGRIAIEELPEDHEEIPKSELARTAVRPKSTDVTVARHEAKEVPRAHVTEDVIHVGKLDVSDLEKRTVESRTVEERVTTHRDRLDGAQKARKEEKPTETRIEPSYIQETDYLKKREETKSRVDDTRISRREISSEKVIVTRADGTRTEETELLKYPQERDIGRIVIEEIPEEKDDKPEIYRKHPAKPRTTEVTVKREDVEDVSRLHEKDVMKTGRLDVHGLERTPEESKIKEERSLTSRRDVVELARKVRKADSPKERIDRVHIQDTEFDEAHKTKPRTDDTEISRQQVTTEKITVNRRDIARSEETEKGKYPRDLDIGRIIIEEIPEDKAETSKREVSRDRPGTRSTELTMMRHEIEEAPRARLTEDVIKVGKLDVTELEKTAVQSRRLQEGVSTYRERVETTRKPRKEEKLEGKPTEQRYIEDFPYPEETRHEVKPCLDETTISRGDISTEKVTVATADGKRTEEIERSRYPKEQDVGRIIIEEVLEEKEEPHVYRKYPEKPKASQVSVTRDYVTDVSRPYEKENVARVEQLDARELRKSLDESTKVEERWAAQTERLQRPEKGKWNKKIEYQSIDQPDVKDVEYEKVREFKSRKEDRVSMDQITTDKVTVSRRDIARTEDTEKPRYPKELDIGRIVIEELPEEKEGIQKREFKGKALRPKSTEVGITRHEVQEVPSTYVSEDVVKVGKLDVTDLKTRTVESRRVEKRVTTYEDNLNEARKPRKEEMPVERRLEPSYIEDVDYLKNREETKSRVDDTRISRREISSEKVIVTRADETTTEETELLKYPQERDIGRIVVEEMPEEKDDKPEIYRKQPGKPRTTEVTVKKGDVEDVSRPHEKEDVMKIGRLDVHDLERTPVESKRTEERSLISRREMVEQPRKVRKTESPKDHDRVYVQDVEFDEAHKTKPRTDDTEISQQHVTTEKITVNRRDIARPEETEKARYPRDLDIGRIVIEEIPEDKVETSQREVLRDRTRPRSTELTFRRHEAEEAPKTRLTEDVIKVGKLEVTDLEKMAVESRRLEEKVSTYREQVEGARKPKEERSIHRKEPRYIEDVRYIKDERKQTEPRVDETSVYQRGVDQEMTITRGGVTVREEAERAIYPGDHEVGRIIVEEKPEKDTPRDLYDERQVRITELATRQEVKDITKPSQKDVGHVGRLDVFEKQPVESGRVEERRLYETERITEPRQTRREKPQEQQIDHIYTSDVEYDKLRRQETKPRTDDTQVSRKHVTTEKVTITRRDVTRTDEMEEPKYAKDLDIGRILIEEILEEKEEVPKHEVSRKDDMVRRYEIDEIPKTHVKEDVIKVGKLDLTDFEKTLVESKRVEERIATRRERVQKSLQPRKEERLDERKSEPRHVEDVSYLKEAREETKPRVDETRVARREVAAEKVTVTKIDGTREEGIEQIRYPRQRDVGRIVIEETEAEKPKEVHRKLKEMPKSTELTVARKDVSDILRPREVDFIKGERTDISGPETAPGESKRVEENFLTETERIERHRTVKRDEKPEDQTFDRLYVKDTEYEAPLDKAYRPLTDDAQVFRKQVTTEKVTVSRRDITSAEEIEKPRYPKELDIGRIVIDEIPEKKDEIRKHEVSRQDNRPKSSEVAVTREMKEIPRQVVTKEETRVCKIDETDVEKKPWERRGLDERVTMYTDRVDGSRKPRKEEKPEEERLDQRHIEDVRYHEERREDIKSHVDETRVSRREVAKEKVTVTRADETVIDETKRNKYPKEQEVGRIVIEEIREKKEEPEKIEGLRKVRRDERAGLIEVDDVEKVRRYEKKAWEDETKVPRKQVTTEKVSISRHDITRIETTDGQRYPKDVDIGRIVIEEIPEEKEPTPRRVKDVRKAVEKEETIKVGKLDLRDLEKDVVQSSKTEQRLVMQKDKIERVGKIVTDQRSVTETRRGTDVAEDKVLKRTKPTDQVYVSDESGRLVEDKPDGGWHIDEETGHWKPVVTDNVWEESIKPLEGHQEETIVLEQPVSAESITVTKEDRKKINEDVKVSVRKVESAEKKEEKKVRRFKIDESRDVRGMKKDKLGEIRVKEKSKKETEEKRKAEPKEPVEEKQKHLIEKQTQTKEKMDEKDRQIEYYQRKEKERLRKAHERRLYEEDRFHMKRASSDPWIQVRRKEKQPEFEIRATQDIHQPSRHIERYDERVRRKPATLPWIEVRRRGTERDHESLVGKQARHGYELSQQVKAKDRLLILKIPQKLFISMQNGDKEKMKEIEIPWMEIEATRDVSGDSLPWIEIEARDPKTGRDRLILLKIPREMVLKTSKFSRSAEREIRLPWNDVTRYWEETGQIPLGSSVRMRMGPTPSMSITLPKDMTNGHSKSSFHQTAENLPTIRLIMPKKFYAEKSWQDRALINVDPNRRIKLRFNNQSQSKAVEDVRTIRLNDYERKNDYVPVALTRGYPRHVLLADGTSWKRLEVDDLTHLDKEQFQPNQGRFSNAYEIGNEAEAQSFPDLREFAKQKSGNTSENPKVFSFLINADKK